jgi:hypothetical protein
MKNKLLQYAAAVALLFIGHAVVAQEIAVGNFTKDEADQTARVISPRKDNNNKVCAVIKIETVLQLQDFTFDAGMIAVEDTEQKTGEIWVWLSPGAQRLTILHKYLGAIRNYQFGEALKEATVYILKLKSGSVRTVIEEDVALQYIEIICAEEGASVRIDEAEPEFFVNGKFEKPLPYGKHKYMVEAPMYHPESGITEIMKQKSEPVKIALKPKFGKLTITTQPEQGADIFIDDEKRGQSPLTIERLGSGRHNIRVIKPQFLLVSQEITMTDGTELPLTLTMKPNFAVITLTTPDGGDIYINDEKKAATQWSGRLTSGEYKIEVHKPSHRPSVRAITARAGENQTIELAAPAPLYGSLDVKSGGIQAAIFVDGKEHGTTPAIIPNVLMGNRIVELRAADYKPFRQTLEVREGKMETVNAALQEEDKTATLKITSNPSNALVFFNNRHIGTTPLTKTKLLAGTHEIELRANGYNPYIQALVLKEGETEVVDATLQKEAATLRITSSPSNASVSIDGTTAGTTPVTKTNLPLGKKTVSFTKDGYKPLQKTIDLMSGNNEIEGVLKQKKVIRTVWMLGYRFSPPTSYLGVSLGVCKRVGGYVQFRTDVIAKGDSKFLTEEDLMTPDENFNGGEKKYYRSSLTAGGLLRLFSFLYLYGGAGYGKYGTVYESEAYLIKSWYSAGLIKGLELEYGATFRLFKICSLTAGYSTIIGSDFGELHFGAGFIF